MKFYALTLKAIYCEMVILFDGVCNLCNGFVKFIIKRDKKGIFKFAALQSAYGKGLIEHFKIAGNGLDTVLLYDGKQVFTRSDASIKILCLLGGIWSASLVFVALPRFMRNGIYNFIAKKRYKLFGKQENCMVPTDEIKSRFLNDTRFQ